MATRLKKLQINEVSLCDRGANPGAMITLFKRDRPTEIEVPEEYEDPKFNASGKGPMHERLWTLYDDNRRSMNYAKPAFQAAWADLTPDEKATIRDEEAAHTAAVAAAAVAEQQEAEKEMAKSDTDILIRSARAIACGDFANDVISKSRWHLELRKYAGERRQDGETIEGSVLRLVKSGDRDARALFAAVGTGVADDAPAAAPAPVVKVNLANLEIRKLADELMAADPELNKYSALLKVHATRPDLAAKAKAESFAS
jgi:hypothetical protein